MNTKHHKTIRVMLVEDSPEYRRVIAIALAKASDIEVVSEFGTAEIALRSLQDAQDTDTPDLILLDVQLPGMNGIEALPHFTKERPKAPIIMLTQSDTEADVVQSISQGAAGYLLKTSTAKQICQAIRDGMKGGAPLDGGVTRHVIESLRGKPKAPDAEEILTQRELEILSLLGTGLVKKEVAKKLNIHYKTVDAHVSNIYQKLDVTNAPSAITRGHELGILPMGKGMG